jgi:hypothetical protein
MRGSWILLLLITGCASMRVQPNSPAASVEVLDPRLASSIERLRQYSEPFRTEWDAIALSGTPIVIGTDRQLDGLLPLMTRNSEDWVGTTSLEPAGRPAALKKVVVVIRLDLLAQVEQKTRHLITGDVPEDPRTFELALDHLLTHELFGHAIPAAQAGRNVHPCPDWVRPGETVSCVEQRVARIHLPPYYLARTD